MIFSTICSTASQILCGGEAYRTYWGTITVSDHVFIGANTTILAGVTIGSNAVIAAGSLVNKDIPDNVVAVGNPCKVVKVIE